MAPRVPVLRDSARTAPLPGVRVQSTDRSAENFGRLGEAFGQASEVAQQARLRSESIAFDKGMIDLDEALAPLESRALATQNEEAIGIPQTALGDMDAAAGKIIESMGSEAVKQRLRDEWRKDRILRTRRLESHAQTQEKRLDDQSTAARMAIEDRKAVDSPYDPIAVLGAIDTRKRLIVEYHRRNGIGADNDLTKEAVTQATSATWAGVVQARLDRGDDIAAEELYQDRKGEIVPEHRQRLEAQIEVGSRLGQSQRIADRIIGSGASLTEAREQWREIEDPKLRDMVQQRVEREFGLRQRAEQEAKDGLFQRAHDLIGTTGGRVEFLSSWMTDLDANQTESLQRHQANLLNGGPKQNDNRVWTGLATMNRQQWAGMSQQQLLAFEPYLDQTHYDRAVAMWSEARDPVSGTPTLTFKDRVETAVRSMPFFDFDEQASDWDEEQREFFALFEGATAREVGEAEERLGRKLSPEEMQQVVDGMVRTALRVPRKSTGPIVWQKEADLELQRAALNAAGLDPLAPALGSIPPEERAKIENRLRGSNRSITPDKIERFYAAFLMGDEVAGQRILEEP